jgi:hypothetical protein
MAIPATQITKQIITDIMNEKTRLCEMVGVTTVGTSNIDVPVNARIDIATIISDDDDPKFVNVEVIRAGISKGNNRRYNNNLVKEVNDMVPGVQGFFGHPDPSKFGFEFREPQSIFVGSMIDHMPDGLDRCIAKAYLFKTSLLREWVPKSIAVGNPMTVSINGTGDIMRNGDLLDVIHMSDLQSIDWANPGTEGMETSKAMSVVTEMQDNNKGGITMSEVLTVQDVMKNATVTEFKAFNPTGYEGILKGITVTELQAMNPALVSQIMESGKITELAYNVGSEKKTVKITELQSLVDGYESKITEMTEKAETAKITEYKNVQLVKLVPESIREKISGRVSGKTTADIDKSIETEIAYVREMGGFNNLPAPRTPQGNSGTDSAEAIMKNMFGVKEKK